MLIWQGHLASGRDQVREDPAPVAVQLHLEPKAEVLAAIPLRRVTAYNPLPSQTDADPHTSSCGPNRPDQIALSRDLFFDANGRKHLCGAKVKVIIYAPDGSVEDVMTRVVWDTMASRFTNTADIYLDHTDVEEALVWGVKRGALLLSNTL